MDACGWQRLADWFAAQEPAIRRAQLEISSLPSPTGQESAKAARIARELRALGLSEVGLDEVGNACGVASGPDPSPALALCAHLDTAFTPETDFTARSEGNLLLGPGIGDNTAGVVMLLALAQALQELAITPRGRLIFFFPVGEEGRGDLLGTRHFFAHSPLAKGLAGFISLDHGGPDVVNAGIGSRRWEITVSGPGGHSWGDFGRVNPIAVLAEAIAEWSGMDLAGEPRRTCSVGRITGGTTVNAIPGEARLELDLRCTTMEGLEALEREVMARLEATLARHNLLRRPPDSAPARLERVPIGRRPTGQTPRDHPLVQAACSALRELGYRPRLLPSSTDANVPMSLGIPAVTLWRGGRGGMIHTPREWYDPANRDHALLVLARVVDAMVGLAHRLPGDRAPA